jgi:hypothetical protein
VRPEAVAIDLLPGLLANGGGSLLASAFVLLFGANLRRPPPYPCRAATYPSRRERPRALLLDMPVAGRRPI